MGVAAAEVEVGERGRKGEGVVEIVANREVCERGWEVGEWLVEIK